MNFATEPYFGKKLFFVYILIDCGCDNVNEDSGKTYVLAINYKLTATDTTSMKSTVICVVLLIIP